MSRLLCLTELLRHCRRAWLPPKRRETARRSGYLIRRAQVDRRDVLPDRGPFPPGARLPKLPPAGEPVTVELGPDEGRRRAGEGVTAQQGQDVLVAGQQLVQERHEPRVGVAGRQGGEPHLPVQPQMVGRDLRRPPPRITRLALELVLLPRGALGD